MPIAVLQLNMRKSAKACGVKRGNQPSCLITNYHFWRLNIACKDFFFEGLKEEVVALFAF
jgi:hypothetical protein